MGVEEKNNELEILLNGLPAEKQNEIRKLMMKAGLRDDDYTISLLHVTGYIDTMYSKIPSALNEVNNTLKDKVNLTKTEICNIAKESKDEISKELSTVISEIKKERTLLTKEKKDFEERQELISRKLNKACEVFLSTINQVNENSKILTEQEKVRTKSLVIGLINEVLPKAVNKNIGELINKDKEVGLKNVAKKVGQNLFLIVCAVLLSDIIKTFFIKVGNVLGIV